MNEIFRFALANILSAAGIFAVVLLVPTVVDVILQRYADTLKLGPLLQTTPK